MAPVSLAPDALWSVAAYLSMVHDVVFGMEADDRGLRFRPLAETVRETLAWHATRPADTTLRAGLSPDREAELLALWHLARQE